VDAVLYSLQIALGVLVFLSIRISGALSAVVLGLAYIIGIGFFCAVHFLNQRAVERRPAESPAGD
jgi:uncharacterized membrane protein HdeD (DUF308 family)